MHLEVATPCDLKMELDKLDLALTLEALNKYPHNKRRAAMELNCCRTGVIYKIRKYNLTKVNNQWIKQNDHTKV